MFLNFPSKFELGSNDFLPRPQTFLKISVVCWHGRLDRPESADLSRSPSVSVTHKSVLYSGSAMSGLNDLLSSMDFYEHEYQEFQWDVHILIEGTLDASIGDLNTRAKADLAEIKTALELATFSCEPEIIRLSAREAV
jgi:hypothetical protein